MRRVEAFVPFLPSKWLDPNRGERRTGRSPEAISDAKGQMRADTATWLLNLDQVKAITEPFDYARISVTLRWDKRRSDGLYRADDPSNAVYALKAFYDGLKDAGLIVDDSYKHVELGAHRIVRGRPEGCLVTVEECERPLEPTETVEK